MDARPQRQPKRWTEEEDAVLYEEAVKQASLGPVKDWHRIAAKLPGRTNKDCRKRWINKVCGGLRSGPWSEAEDDMLRQAVATHGQRWTQVAKEFGSRSPDQCAKRWQYTLDPKLEHREWTAGEDHLLLELVQKFGRDWKFICYQHYPTRSRNDVKNRYTILSRRLVSGAASASDNAEDPCSPTSSMDTTVAAPDYMADGSEMTGAIDQGMDQGLQDYAYLDDLLSLDTTGTDAMSSFEYHNFHAGDFVGHPGYGQGQTSSTNGAVGAHHSHTVLGQPGSSRDGAADENMASPLGVYGSTAVVSPNGLEETDVSGTGSSVRGGAAPPGFFFFDGVDDVYPDDGARQQGQDDVDDDCGAGQPQGYSGLDNAEAFEFKLDSQDAASSTELDLSRMFPGLEDPSRVIRCIKRREEVPSGESGSQSPVFKVVLEVDKCDHELVKYLIDITRPIQAKVKMEMAM